MIPPGTHHGKGDDIRAKIANIRSPNLVNRSKLKKFVSFGKNKEVISDLETGQTVVEVEVTRPPLSLTPRGITVWPMSTRSTLA